MVDTKLNSYNELLKSKGYDGVRVFGVKSNIAKADEVESLVRRVIAEQGRLDWFVSRTRVGRRSRATNDERRETGR